MFRLFAEGIRRSPNSSLQAKAVAAVTALQFHTEYDLISLSAQSCGAELRHYAVRMLVGREIRWPRCRGFGMCFWKQSRLDEECESGTCRAICAPSPASAATAADQSQKRSYSAAAARAQPQSEPRYCQNANDRGCGHNLKRYGQLIRIYALEMSET